MKKSKDFEVAKRKYMSIFYNRSVNKKKDIIYAVELSFRDMQVRTIEGFSEVKEESKVALREWLCEQIDNYFRGDAPSSEDSEEFDLFHKKLCKTIIEWFRGKLPYEKREQFTYGKAQKLVNMTFKNLYCFEDAVYKEEHFRHCHIPIDSIIISAFKKMKVEAPKIDNKEVKWSKMNYETYWAYTTKLRNKVNEQYETPLQAEFVIWNQEKTNLDQKDREKWNKKNRDFVAEMLDEIGTIDLKDDKFY